MRPRLNGGNPDQLPQNCNAVGARIVGSETESMLARGQRVAVRTAARLAPTAWQAYRNAYNDLEQPFDENARTDAIAQEYVTALPNSQQALATAGANQHAKPAVGEAYMIATIGGGVPQPNGTSRVRDFATGTDRDLGWSFHFAGVVARSGTDRVTLENYARGDNRQNGADPRWYFQMYGEQATQTFHEVNASSPHYANPVTVTVGSANDTRALHYAD